jgi:tight adherence protein B
VTGGWWLVMACLIGAAGLIAWSPAGNRTRWRALAGGSSGGSGQPGTVGSSSGGSRQPAIGWRMTLPDWVGGAPRRATLLAAGLAAAAGAVLGGPVAAVAGLAYGGLAARTALRRRTVRTADRARRRQLDGLCALAADLRAGLPVGHALSSSADPAMRGAPPSAVRKGSVEPADRISGLAQAAVRLAEQTGAPLADLLERIEADARAMDRGLAAAAAQAAGARATAMLLAGLPLGGIALGYGIGVDPLAVLLHTPIGAGCAVGAIVLQLAGLAWADRLSGSALRAV